MPELEDQPGIGENPANPGRLEEAVWTFNDGDREWQESMNLAKTLREVLGNDGLEIEVDGPVVLCNGFRLRPLLVSMTPIHKEGVRTSTTIEVKHPELVPSPVFEYQHSSGTDLENSIREGFQGWRDTDFVPLRDCLRHEAETCGELSWKGRRVVLGPVTYLQQNPAPPASDDHDFCPCCLFTNSKNAFESLIDTGGFLGLRLFASRDANGEADADCRVNGEDFEAGRQALLRYVQSWPGSGLEYRKQYVILPAASRDAGAPTRTHSSAPRTSQPARRS